MYIHELEDWPRFHWSAEAIAEPLASVSHRQGRLTGHMEALGFSLRQEAVLQTLTADVLKSSEIEGEKLDAEQVRSSIARRLGMDIGALKAADRHVEGVVEMMLDATRHYDQPLMEERLFDWHASLFPTGRSGMTKIRPGAWRDDSTGPMQVVSGPHGQGTRPFRSAEGETCRPGEMKSFLDWFEGRNPIDPVLKAGLAHLWFVTIHPFDDGNGRIARADRRHGAGALGEQRPAFLQHVGADPAGKERLLRHPGTDAERDDGRDTVDGLVSRLPRPRHRRGPGDAERRACQGAVLGPSSRMCN